VKENTLRIKTIILMLGLLGLIIVICCCEKGPTKPTLVTSEEVENIPFDRLQGKIYFRRFNPETPELYYFMALDAEKKTLTGLAQFDMYVPTNLALSPNGEHLLFSYYILKGITLTFAWQLYVMEINSLAIRNVAPSEFNDSYSAWSPGGDMISFWSNRDLKSAIWLTDFPEDSSRLLIEVAEIARTRCAWLPDGAQLVYSDTDSNQSAVLILLELETWDKQTILREDESSELIVYKHLSIAPDGKQIAFVKAYAGGYDELWIMNLESRETLRLTTGESDWHPVWSPDGSQIIFSRGYALYLIKADGTELERVTRGKGLDEFPTWGK